MPVRKRRLPVCTASAYVPNGSGGAGSLIPSSFNRCSALTGREPSAVTISQRAQGPRAAPPRSPDRLRSVDTGLLGPRDFACVGHVWDMLSPEMPGRIADRAPLED